MKILIVKVSSLGDIIQSLNVVDYLSAKDNIDIHWVVEKPYFSIIQSNPLIAKTILFDIKRWKKNLFKKRTWISIYRFITHLKKEKYDVIFDLQGNCKSALITLFSKGTAKVGFGRKTVKEWPNLLSTKYHIDVDKHLNMRLQYLEVVKKYFLDFNHIHLKGVRLKINELEKLKLQSILSHPNIQTNMKVMICPGAKWPSKQLSFESLLSFMRLIQNNLNASFLLIWGNELEKFTCRKLNQEYKDSSIIIDKLPIPLWQNLMNDVDLVVAMDSSSLHLCGTISTPSFSIFGPTIAEVFKPIGDIHFAYQAKCPYNKLFSKQCPDLRTCITGACTRYLKSDEIYSKFIFWWNKINKKMLVSK